MGAEAKAEARGSESKTRAVGRCVQSYSGPRAALSHRNSMEFALLDFELVWARYSFIPFLFSLLECDCLSYAYPTTVFWKQINCVPVA